MPEKMSANRARDSRETVRRKRRERTKENLEFYECIRDIVSHPAVLEMKKYYQHCDTDCYEHCLDVAYNNYKICKKLGLDARTIIIKSAKNWVWMLAQRREAACSTICFCMTGENTAKRRETGCTPSPIRSLPIEMPANIFI